MLYAIVNHSDFYYVKLSSEYCSTFFSFFSRISQTCLFLRRALVFLANPIMNFRQKPFFSSPVSADRSLHSVPSLGLYQVAGHSKQARSSPAPTENGGKKTGGTLPLNKALLDTDTFSEFSKDINPTVAANATTYHQAFGRYMTPTVMEIVRGFQRVSSTRRLQAFVASIATLELLPFDRAVAKLAGRIADGLERIGQPIGVADPMIGAIALTQSL